MTMCLENEDEKILTFKSHSYVEGYWYAEYFVCLQFPEILDIDSFCASESSIFR